MIGIQLVGDVLLISLGVMSSEGHFLKFDRFMAEQGYSRCHSDHSVYFKRLDDGSYIILLLYVDDMLVAGVDGGKNPLQQREIVPVPQVPIRLMNVWCGRLDKIMDPLSF